MNSNEIRQTFLQFFEKRGHTVIPSASLVPANDPSVLFTTAGMQPLVPYLLGQPHPAGKRLVNIQKCVRTQDIDEVGDNTHDTFFEMMGNWSLGDYFKTDAIQWSFELLTSKEEGFGLDINRLYITVFEGDENAPKDIESAELWIKAGVPENHIYYMGAKSNWWSVGENGPCGPDTEMFYDITPEGLGDMTKEEFVVADEKQQIVEIWNDVFMQYEKKDGKVIGQLPNKNVDTGSGLERIAMVLQGKTNIFDTDLFVPIMSTIGNSEDQKPRRVLADHIRTAVFMIADGVTPNKDERGYVPRRLIRRAMTVHFLFIRKGLDKKFFYNPVNAIINIYKDTYPYLKEKEEEIIKVIGEEVEKFSIILVDTVKDLEKIYNRFSDDKNRESGSELDGQTLFRIRETHGVGFEIMKMVLEKLGYKITEKTISEYDNAYKENQEKSRKGSTEKFKGGLANTSQETVKLHTAHHLLLAALQKVLGAEVKQRGSNITEERLRIDFAFPRKMTDEEKVQVETIVNENIKKDLQVVRREMPKIEAENLGAEMEFGAKYPDIVSLYFIEDANGNAVSKEFCGGPHVERTGELGHFKIVKEEPVSAGVRRIKAILE